MIWSLVQRPLPSRAEPSLCSDHVDHCYSDLYPTKTVEFYRLDDEDDFCLEPKLGSETDMLYGDVYLDAYANCGFGPFRPLKRARRKAEISLPQDEG